MVDARESLLVSPERLDAVILDMDGVITDTAEAHAGAWKQLFDEYLEARAQAQGTPFEPFDAVREYRDYVDGKPRYDGVKSFLESRGIELPWGDPTDGPERETVCGLGNRKNGYFNAWLETKRVPAFPGTIHLIKDLHAAGIKTAIFSSSANAGKVLRSAGVLDLFDAKVDGEDLARLKMPGKPDPDMLLEATARVGARPERTAVLEDALSGVEAGARGGFGFVVGVDRVGYADALRASGAHAVVPDASHLVVEDGRLAVNMMERVPSAWERKDEIEAQFAGKQPAIFLDYDGTLTPIVVDYTKAFLSDEMRDTLKRLAERYTVGAISGRDLKDLRHFIELDNLFYAGSHGFDLSGPQGWHETAQMGVEFLPELDATERELATAATTVPGCRLERKLFSIAVHFRQVAEEREGEVETFVDRILAAHPRLRKGLGKKVFEIRPRVDWDKGRALHFFLKRLGLDGPDVVPIYVGDDITDEDAFRALLGRGLGLVVRDPGRSTAARYALEDVEDVRRFLEMLIARKEGGAR